MEEITESEVSILEISKEELQDKYNNLKKAVHKCKNSLEAKNQKIFDLQRELTRISSLEQEYIQELEILQSNDKGEVKKFEMKINELQDELLVIKVKNRESVLELEQAIFKKDEEIVSLKEQITANAKCQQHPEVDGQQEKLLEENGALKEEIECLVQKLKDNEVRYTDLSKRLEKISLEKEDEYNNMQEILKTKKEELSEVKTLMETMQEENILMRSELEIIRNKPSDTDARGNSLFAEVNDRRVQLQRNMDKMKSHYLEMKGENVTLMNQVATLKIENTFLSQQWKDDVIQREVDDAALIQSFKSRVEKLEELNKSYEKLMEERIVLKSNMPADELKCVQMMLENKDKLLQEAWNKQKEQSMKLLCISTELYNSNKELREWKSKAFNLKSKLAELETNEKDTKKEKEMVVCKCQEELNERRVKFLKHQQKQQTQQVKPTSQCVEIDIRTFLFGGDLKKNNQEEEKENNLNKVNEVKEEHNSSEKSESVVASVLKDENKEKVNTEKKKCVQFAEDTLENNKENSTRPRRRGNIISCPVIYIPSAHTTK